MYPTPPSYVNFKFPALALIASSLLVLSACGGGGGGGGSSSATMDTEEAPSEEAPSTLTGRNITISDSSGTRIYASEAVLAKAAVAQPRPGSVTQSSDSSDNPSGTPVSNDVVTVTVGYDSTTQSLAYHATYNGIKVVDTADSTDVDPNGTENSIIEYLVNEGVGTQKHQFFTYADWRSAEFYRHLSGEEIDSLEGNPAGTNGVDGQLWIDIYTDYDDSVVGGDTDYLAGGIWVYRDDDATSLDDYEYGAFLDGSDPFEEADLAGLTGTAQYDGGATGVYADAEDTERNYFFDANVQLTADFDTNMISGEINNITDEDGFAYSPVVTLASAPIGSTHSGFFTGNTSLTSDGEDYTGKWGGQFYGNDRSDGTPGSVGGTFGGATESGHKGFLGVFGAHQN